MDNSISIRTDKAERAIQITEESIGEYKKAFNDVIVQLKCYENNISDDISISAREYLSNANKAIVQAIEKLAQINVNFKRVIEDINAFEKRGLRL